MTSTDETKSTIKVQIDEHTSHVILIAENGEPMAHLFFHRMHGNISNTSVVLEEMCTFKHVVPTVIYDEAIQKPALVKQTP